MSTQLADGTTSPETVTLKRWVAGSHVTTAVPLFWLGSVPRLPESVAVRSPGAAVAVVAIPTIDAATRAPAASDDSTR